MAEPKLMAAEVEVDPVVAGEIAALWDRFEIFEALHHRQTICNPMTEAEFEALLDLLGPGPGVSMVDIACGSGELLIRCHEHGATSSTGLDLSPWMLDAAATRAAARLGDRPRPRWLLTDAARRDLVDIADRVVCLGADWIWHGMAGTVAALALRVTPGGRVAYGGPRLNFGADPATVTVEFGRLDTVAGVEARLAECGLSLVERIDPGETGWVAYLDRGRECAAEWAELYPGEKSERWVAEQAQWRADFERDREIVGWSVWVADRV